MKVELLLLPGFFGLAWSGPARWGCQEECVTASNECAMTYVACRTGCGDATSAPLPTLAAPICPPNASGTSAPEVSIAYVATSHAGNATSDLGNALATDVPTVTADRIAMITPPPEDPLFKPGYCRAAWVCDDLFAVCGGTMTRGGGCYDVCKGRTFSAPVCTVAPDPDTEPARGGLNMKQLEKIKQDAADRLAAGGEKCNYPKELSRCKPKGW